MLPPNVDTPGKLTLPITRESVANYLHNFRHFNLTYPNHAPISNYCDEIFILTTNALIHAKRTDASLGYDIPTVDWAKSYKTSDLEAVLSMHLAQLPEEDIKPSHSYVSLQTALCQQATMPTNDISVTYEMVFTDTQQWLANLTALRK